MIEIRAKGPGLLEGTHAHLEAQFPLDRPVVWIGRGEELLEREAKGPPSYAMNLNGLSQAVSRIHACLLLSPAFFSSPQQLPSFLLRLPLCAALPSDLPLLIWQFLQSPRKILLKDLSSKTGIFKKVSSCKVEAGLQVVLGDSRPLRFHNQEIYDSCEELRGRVQELVGLGYAVMNPGEGAVSFWLAGFKGLRLILLDRPGRVMVGRSSDCHLAIPEASISRRHAHLDYWEGEWRLGDGDGVTASSNGVWVRARRMWVEHRQADLQVAEGERVAKVGDVLLSFAIKEQHSFLGVEDCLENSNEEVFDQLLRRELAEASSASVSAATEKESNF